MAHFAEIGLDNKVLRVIVISNEYESNGEQWCRETFGGVWKQTSYTKKIRKNYAGVGFSYDSSRDAFIPPKSYPSWILNEETCIYEAPVPYPNDGQMYIWDEVTKSWVL
jgi:hypothetical protein